MTNPYQSPDLSSLRVEDNSTPVSRYRLAIWTLAYFFPVWLVGSFYATWLIAWMLLGHPPRPMLDDPKSIGNLMDAIYIIPGILMLGIPVLTPIGFAASFFCPIRSNLSQSGPLAVLFIALCVFGLMLLRWDPHRVVEWWFD